MLLLLAFTPSMFESSGWLVAWHGWQLLFLLIVRQVQRALVRLANRRRLLRRRVVIIGANAVAKRVIRDMLEADPEGYEILAVFRDPSDGETANEIAGIHVAGDFETLNAFALSETTDVVILALPWRARPPPSG